MNRFLYGRVTISGDVLRAGAAIDRALSDRMKAGGLTPKQCSRAWARIRGARWHRVLAAEIAQLNEDLKVRFADRIAADLNAPTLLSRFL